MTPNIILIDPEDFVDDTDLACVDACDHHPNAEIQTWWEWCVDQCLENSPNREKVESLSDALFSGKSEA
jgi:hypothetical protein